MIFEKIKKNNIQCIKSNFSNFESSKALLFYFVKCLNYLLLAARLKINKKIVLSMSKRCTINKCFHTPDHIAVFQLKKHQSNCNYGDRLIGERLNR